MEGADSRPDRMAARSHSLSTEGLGGRGREQGGAIEPGQEWGPFPLEILDALGFPRPLPQSEEAGRSRDRAKLADGRDPGDWRPLAS